MISFYWAPRSRAVRVFWALEEVGAPYRVTPVDIRGGDRPSGFLSASPLGKVPAIRDGDVAMADSAAIMLYLGDRYAPGRLVPEIDDPARGEFLTWMLFVPSAFEPAMTEKFAALEPNPAAYPWGSWDRMIGAVETRLTGREWVAWDRFTMADIMLAGALQFAEAFRMHKPTAKQRAYVERCFARDAALRGQARDTEETARLDAAAG